MTEKEILLEIKKSVDRLNQTLLAENRKVMTTKEACDYLDIVDGGRVLTHFYNKGILTQRYGAQNSGYKYSKAEINTLQTKLLTGEIQLPKR